MARIDGNWRSKIRTLGQDVLPPAYEPFRFSPAGWVVNGRIALRDIKLSHGDLEVALWGKNLTDQDRIMFPINFFFLGSASYERAL